MNNLNFSTCKETYDFQSLENEALFIADHKNVKNSAFGWKFMA